MDIDEPALFTIGQLTRRVEVPVRTIRYWSDVGLLHPARRAEGGYRLYDASSVARAELVRTLRELGLGLEDVRRVLESRGSLAEMAAAHVEALDAQIRTLRLTRAILSTVVKRGASTEEVALMNRLAKLSARERRRIVDDFLDEVLGGQVVVEGMRAHLRGAVPELPEDPSPEQVEAWVELAELIQDPDFRAKVRALAEYTARQGAEGGETEVGEDAVTFARRVVEYAGAALQSGVEPESEEGADLLARILDGAANARNRADLLEELDVVSDARAERYWELVRLINGWPPYPARVPSFEHVASGLRAHGWVAAALRAHGCRGHPKHRSER